MMVPTRAMRGAQRRGLTEELELSQHHRHEEQQHGDVAWTEPTSTPPRGRSQLPFSNAFEFGGERHGVLMLCRSPTRWAQRRRVRETLLSICRYVLISLGIPTRRVVRSSSFFPLHEGCAEKGVNYW